jgi:glycosyltransferase involved in cell wall biosynthesis
VITKHVVHVTPVLFGPQGFFGGGERYPLELSRAMAERVPTTLVCFGTARHREQLGNLEVQTVPNWINHGFFQFDPFNAALLRCLSDADIIHCHQSRTMASSLALVYGQISGKPVFTTPLGGGGLGLYSIFQRLYQGHLHISRYSLKAHHQEGLRTAKVILGGVDPDKYKPDPGAQNNGDVLYVGRLLPHKGINYLIEAADNATPLRVIGRPGGPWRNADRYYQLLVKLALGKRVAFETSATDADIVQACQRSLCIVLPSVYTDVYGGRSKVPELLGLTAIEGMACGLPAIVTDVGSLPEVVEDGVTGFVVPPNSPDALAEKIRWLRANPETAREIGACARQRVLKYFTWERVVDRCFEAYGIA